MPPKDSLAVLIKKADAVFSKYIRARDANKQNPFYLNCFTCGKPERIEFAHCMHYIRRDQMAVRFEEMNAHGGCETCNCFDPEHHEKYKAAMTAKYSKAQLEYLEWRSKSLAKFTAVDLREIIEHFQAKLKSLKP